MIGGSVKLRLELRLVFHAIAKEGSRWKLRKDRIAGQ
jgi:hypothetical protein